MQFGLVVVITLNDVAKAELVETEMLGLLAPIAPPCF
jgi:hypothetical protein